MAKILVVEDEKPIARPISLKLKFSGFDVCNAYDGQEALEVLKKETFDLILLDIIMPKMNGFEVLAQLKAQGNKTPIIVISNLSQDEDIEKVKSFGAFYFVKSNIADEALVGQIKTMLKI